MNVIFVVLFLEINHFVSWDHFVALSFLHPFFSSPCSACFTYSRRFMGWLTSLLLSVPSCINRNFWHEKAKVHAVLKSRWSEELWKHEVSFLSIRELMPQWARMQLSLYQVLRSVLSTTSSKKQTNLTP